MRYKEICTKYFGMDQETERKTIVQYVILNAYVDTEKHVEMKHTGGVFQIHG